jgi:hypothetical protein
VARCEVLCGRCSFHSHTAVEDGGGADQLYRSSIDAVGRPRLDFAMMQNGGERKRQKAATVLPSSTACTSQQQVVRSERRCAFNNLI